MMPPPSPAVMERVNNPDRLVTILSLDQLRVWVPQIPYLSPSMRWPIEGFVCCSAKCHYWPISTFATLQDCTVRDWRRKRT